MRGFDEILVADWSAGRPGPRHPKAPPRDKIYLASPGRSPLYLPSRHDAIDIIRARIDAAIVNKRRLLIGIDVGFGLPKGVTATLTGSDHALALWALLANRIVDDQSTGRHNAFEVAATMNATLPGDGPFWGRLGVTPAELPATRPKHSAYAPLRETEQRLSGRPKSMFQMAYAGAVGAQSLLAMAALWDLRENFGARLAVWPFDDPRDAPVVMAELYLSTLPLPHDARQRRSVYATEIAMTDNVCLPMTDASKAKDPLQVAIFAATLNWLAEQRGLADLLRPPPDDTPWREEGWVLGTGHEDLLRDAARKVLQGDR